MTSHATAKDEIGGKNIAALKKQAAMLFSIIIFKHLQGLAVVGSIKCRMGERCLSNFDDLHCLLLSCFMSVNQTKNATF